MPKDHPPISPYGMIKAMRNRQAMVTLQLRQIRVPPGQRIELKDVSWEEFEAILSELGESRNTRIAYSQGVLEIVAPLPEHEQAKGVLADLLKALLNEMDADVTSKTQLSAYEALRVPEIWRWQKRKLQISLLQNGKYVESDHSPTFPNLPVNEGISQLYEMSRTVGTRPALKAFRQWIKARI